MSSFLIVRHLDQDRFQISRMDGKSSTPVTLVAPDAIQVPGRPDRHLLQDLAWYLEEFLGYPYPPHTDAAERIQQALKRWGEDCFTRLFAGQALLWYDQARQQGLQQLHLKIASDDPRVLGWPWEALSDPDGTTLAHTCRIERQLSRLHDPLPLPDNLPRDRINILLIIARPYGDRDVGYQALARPLLDRLHTERLPVRIDLLRPPSFRQLQRHLSRRPGFYHMLHFDGHGGYGEAGYDQSGHHFCGVEGRLMFETEDGDEQPVGAAKLIPLLTDHRIPIMLLNACQSARIDARADDPFASVAAALLKAGLRAVVAMGYNLYVSAAQQFVPAFYQRLLTLGDVAEATRAGRRAMLEQEQRDGPRGEYPLQDWLVPVLYQQEALSLPVADLQSQAAPADPDLLPPNLAPLGEHGLIGRQWAIQALERALLRQPQAAILIHGMAGVGKTTLAIGYLHWLQQTNGLSRAAETAAPKTEPETEDGSLFIGAFWFGFDDMHNFEYLVNRLVERLFGHQATAASLEQKLPALIQALRQTPLLMVWDNFESAAGIAGTEVRPLLADADRHRLETLLGALRGGKSKILITSRASETWLGPLHAYRLPLSGLQGEECWAYCNALVRDLGLRIDRADPCYDKLMERLAGHPLALRAVFLRLADTPAESLLAELETAFAGMPGDASTRRIFAALRLLEQSLPADFGPALALLGLHRRYVHMDLLAQIAESAGNPIERATLEACFNALEAGGLLHRHSNGIYAMHSALSGFLAQRHPADSSEQRGFVDWMGRFADQLAPKELHEQRGPFALLGANFHQALALAVQLGMDAYILALTQSLAAFAKNRREFEAARQLFEDLAGHAEAMDNQYGAAISYHQLGRIAEEQRDFAGAGAWFLKAIGLFHKFNDPHSLAMAMRNFARTLQSADQPTRTILRQQWQQAGLDQLSSLDALEQQLAQSSTDK